MNQPDRDALRIGTAEREDAIRILGEHFAQGRLAVDEYESRVGAAAAATVQRDLRPLFADLPAPYPPFMSPPVWAPAPPPPLPYYPPPQPMYYGGPPEHYYSDKSKTVAGLLQIFLSFGIGRFYTGHYGIAIAQLLTCGGLGIWTLVDGIILLAKGGTDPHGLRLRD